MPEVPSVVGPSSPIAPEPALRAPGTPITSIPVYVDTEDTSFEHGWNVPLLSASLDAGKHPGIESLPPPVPPSSGPSPSTVSCDFRHSFWKHRRPRLRRALVDAGAPDSRLTAWDGCGACAWVLQSSDDPSRYRLACHRCHDRFCEACSAEKRRRIVRNLSEKLTERFALPSPRHRFTGLRFLTLSLKSADAPLREQLTRLYSCFGKLRHRRSIAKRLRGGIAFLELTINPKTRLWHPHLHVVFEGDYIDQKGLSALWLSITGDSFVVDIRALNSPARSASYVAKYASKALSPTVLSDAERLSEAVSALRGLRTFNTFGSWSSLGLSDQPPLDGDWVAVSSLPQLLDRANRGDLEARAILRTLKGAPAHETLDLHPQAASSPLLPGLLVSAPP